MGISRDGSLSALSFPQQPLNSHLPSQNHPLEALLKKQSGTSLQQNSSSYGSGKNPPLWKKIQSPSPKKDYKGVVTPDTSRTQYPPSNTISRKKIWKPKKRNRRMVPGADVGLEETCRRALCGLVGRLSYPYLPETKMDDWFKQKWAPLLGYVLEIFFLKKGWWRMVVNTLADANLLLKNILDQWGLQFYDQKMESGLRPKNRILPV